MSKVQGWRTFGFNMLTAILGVIAAADLIPLVPAKYAWAATVIISVANLGLRVITSTPVGKAQ